MKLRMIIAALIATTSGASAADLLAKASPPVVPPFSWTGFYIGGHLGGGWSSFRGSDPATGMVDPDSVHGNGILGGGEIGYNFQTGPWALGIEGEASWSDVKISQSDPFGGIGLNLTVKNDYVATVGGRLGYAFDRWMVYGKGGAAWTRDKVDVADGLGGTATGRFSRTGWMAGVGVEYAFADHWSAKLEYNYLKFGDQLETLTTTGGLAATPSNVELDMQTVKAGINYRF
jgi:outer membrane immunogenic protein